MIALLLAQAAAEPVNEGLNTAGMLVMVGSIGLVLTLCAFCFYRLVTDPAGARTHHAPLEIATTEEE